MAANGPRGQGPREQERYEAQERQEALEAEVQRLRKQIKQTVHAGKARNLVKQLNEAESRLAEVESFNRRLGRRLTASNDALEAATLEGRRLRQDLEETEGARDAAERARGELVTARDDALARVDEANAENVRLSREVRPAFVE